MKYRFVKYSCKKAANDHIVEHNFALQSPSESAPFARVDNKNFASQKPSKHSLVLVSVLVLDWFQRKHQEHFCVLKTNERCNTSLFTCWKESWGRQQLFYL